MSPRYCQSSIIAHWSRLLNHPYPKMIDLEGQGVKNKGRTSSPDAERRDLRCGQGPGGALRLMGACQNDELDPQATLRPSADGAAS